MNADTATDRDPEAAAATSRRTVLSGLGVAAAAAAVGAAPAPVAAQVAPLVPDINATPVTYWNREYTAMKGNIRLQLYRRRAKAPVPGEAPVPVLVLVHGSSMAALPAWDLTVPGGGEYSIMNVFARLGYDVWAIDFEGYGKSSRNPNGNSDIRSGVADLEAMVPIVARETGQQKFHFMGSSSGALRVAAYAAAHPDRVDRAVLGAYTYTGKGSPTLADRAKNVEFYRTNNTRPRPREMLASIFTRDKPGTSDPRAGQALADAELKYGDSVPTGTYLDMTSKLPIIPASAIKCPVLLIRGCYDGIATEEDILEMFNELPNQDKQLIVLAGTAHNLGLSYNRHMFWHASHAFLTMPKPIVEI
jgi:alpha-beta hydrolase superfamily lysophospholipase